MVPEAPLPLQQTIYIKETLPEQLDVEAVGEGHLVGESDEDLAEEGGGLRDVGPAAQFAAFNPPRIARHHSSYSLSISSWSL